MKTKEQSPLKRITYGVSNFQQLITFQIIGSVVII